MTVVQRPRLDPALIARIRARYDISAVADRLGFVTKKVGHEFVGLCPFHSERTPSWKLNDAKGFAHCFGCGANQDTIGLVMAGAGLDFIDALRWLDSSELPPVDPVVRQEQEQATRDAKVRQIADARRFAGLSRLVTTGDPVSIYLRARGITIAPPSSIRFGMVPKWQDAESKEWGPEYPCMVCVAQDSAGQVTGIQRVFFARNDPALGKADKPKRSLGTIRGSPCRLGPAAAHINLAEGPEDGLSAQEIMPERPCWVAFGTSQMPFVQFPGEVRQVTLLGQNNEPGRVAVRKAAAELALRLTVGEAFPPAGYDDWNDLHRGIRSDG